MGLFGRMKQAIQIVVGGHSVGRTVVKGATINGGAYRPKQGEEWLHAYNTMPWLRANVSKIAGGVSSLEWGITRTMDANGMTVKRPDLQHGTYEYRRKVLAAMEDEEKADTTFDHPFLTLLKNPCPALPGKAALILAQVYYEIVGEVFFVVDRGSRDEWLLKGGTGRPLPTALWPVPPHWVKRIPTPDNPTFEIRQAGLQMDKIPLTEVLWLKNPDPVNPYARGVGTFFSLSDELDSDENAAKMIGYSFYNRNRPDLLVSLPGADEVEMRAFKADWHANLQGVGNALKSHFVNIDAKVEQLGYDFREMQVIDLRRHTRDTIRQVPGTPPEILGIQDQSNRATIEAAEYIFGKHVILPRAEVWRDFWQTQLVVEYDDRAILDYVSPVQEDKNFTLNIATGRPEVMKVNEVRKLGGLPALTDEEGGNLFFVNGSFVPSLAQAPAANAMPGAPQGPGGGLSAPGFEGGIFVPGAASIPINVPGAAGSAESGLPAEVKPPALAAPPPPPGPALGGVRPTTLPAPDGNGPGYSLAGRPKPKGVTKIHHPHVVDDGDGFKVVDDDGKVYGTHDNEADAEDQVRALYAAKRRERKGVAGDSARYFRGLASVEVTPDEANLIATWAKAVNYQFDPDAVVKTAPIPVTDDRATEWLRRALAHYHEQDTAPWDRMFGSWSEADTKMFDAMLLKGDYEGHPFRGNQWTTGQGEARDREVAESRASSVIGAIRQRRAELEASRVGGKSKEEHEAIIRDGMAKRDELSPKIREAEAALEAEKAAATKMVEGERATKREADKACSEAWNKWTRLVREGLNPGERSPDMPEIGSPEFLKLPKAWQEAAEEYRATANASEAASKAYFAALERANNATDTGTRGRLESLRAEYSKNEEGMDISKRVLSTWERESTRAAQRSAEAVEPRVTPALQRTPLDEDTLRKIDAANAGRKPYDDSNAIHQVTHAYTQTAEEEALRQKWNAGTLTPDEEKRLEALVNERSSREPVWGDGKGNVLEFKPNFKATVKDGKDFKDKMGKMFPGANIVGLPRNADPHILTMVHDEFGALRDEFPEVAVREVKLNAGGLRATAWSGDDKITFGKDAIESFARSHVGFGTGRTRTDPTERPDFHDGVRSFASVVRHEFGHQLHFQHPELLDEFSREVRKMEPAVRSRVTGYANKNTHELFAEAFTLIKYGDEGSKAHPVVKMLDRITKDYFRRKRGKG